MIKAVSVNFRGKGRSYFFDPNGIELKVGDKVVVETKMGKELGTIKTVNREVDETKFAEALKPIIRKATKEDLDRQAENEKEEKKAFKECKKKIEEYKLNMKLVEVRYLLDNSKLIFYFTADNRIDFRELVKDLASIYRTRIELRQISTREQVRRLGGNGICGRELCCCSYLKNFDATSIKMAKEQNLSLNASKIIGVCGRLMCCLKYEQNVYEDKMKHLPHIGAIVQTADGKGRVDSVEVLNEIIKVKLKDDEGNDYYKKYNPSEVKIIKDTKQEMKNSEDEEEMKELEKIEAIDKFEKKNAQDDDI